MADICLNKEALQTVGISLGEALLMLAIHNEVDLKASEDLLVQKGFITAVRDDLFYTVGWRVTSNGQKFLESAITQSSKVKKKTKAQTAKLKEELLPLATRLKAVFPTGKKAGTSQYWAEGPALIVERLIGFFDRYGRKWTDDQIVAAAQDYVNSFNGDYRFMRVLRYFIWKEAAGNGGSTEPTSDLLNCLTNAGQEDASNTNWMDSVR